MLEHPYTRGAVDLAVNTIHAPSLRPPKPALVGLVSKKIGEHAAHPSQWFPVALGRASTSTRGLVAVCLCGVLQLHIQASGSQWHLGVRLRPALIGLVAVCPCGVWLQTLLRALLQILRPPTADWRLQKARSRSGCCRLGCHASSRGLWEGLRSKFYRRNC